MLSNVIQRRKKMQSHPHLDQALLSQLQKQRKIRKLKKSLRQLKLMSMLPKKLQLKMPKLKQLNLNQHQVKLLLIWIK
jgi:uncharacterized protein YbaP (TraB family)